MDFFSKVKLVKHVPVMCILCTSVHLLYTKKKFKKRHENVKYFQTRISIPLKDIIFCKKSISIFQMTKSEFDVNPHFVFGKNNPKDRATNVGKYPQ